MLLKTIDVFTDSSLNRVDWSEKLLDAMNILQRDEPPKFLAQE
jgi:hypothetical protein